MESKIKLVEGKEPKLQFIEALVKAQLEFKPAEKNSDNPFFKSKYSTYEEVWSAVGKPLNNNGFAVMHMTRIEDGHFMLITRLIHKGGHEEYSEHEVVPENKNNMQGKGSAETYSKRYNLVALTAIPVGGDDDGNAACVLDKDSLLKQIETLSLDLPVERLTAFESWVTKKYKVNQVKQLDANKIKEVLLELEASLRRNKSKGV